MARVYSQRLWIGAVGYAGYATLYTVPAGKVAIVRDIALFNHSGATLSPAGLYIVPAGGGYVPVYFEYTVSLGNNALMRWEGRQVLNEGDSLGCYGSAFPIDVVASGYVFDNA